MIDHSVLIEELRNMHVHPVVVNWIIAFLCNFVTLFDLPQNTKNDKTRQLHKSK